MKKRQRLDTAVVERGLAQSREKARALILAGDVLVGGQPELRAAALVAGDAVIEVVQPARFVSRGGEKLEHALSRFGIDVAGLVVLDAGASTGGFTDCLLQRAAARVYAVDVGHGQLDQRLREDPRVVVMERTHIRDLESLPEQPDLATVDVSFISLALVLPAVARVLAPSADVVALVKPQFEVGREAVGKGGVVRDPALRAEAVAHVRHAAEEAGFAVRGESPSVLPGPKGNQEIFLWLARG
jgi:23S rRNA (cytidine1920-2'-O)/16S rRNA (cytidine1409-2'-O)-methyltransferase